MTNKLKEFITKVNLLCKHYGYSISVSCDEDGTSNFIEIGNNKEFHIEERFPTYTNNYLKYINTGE